MGKTKQQLAFLDTNQVIFLYLGKTNRLTSKSEKVIDTHQLLISPMVSVELAMLKEIGGLKVSPEEIVGSLAKSIGLIVEKKTLSHAFYVAESIQWTRDIGDRIITAHAMALKAPLITTDELIQENYSLAIE